MNLENTMFSKIIQIQKDRYCLNFKNCTYMSYQEEANSQKQDSRDNQGSQGRWNVQIFCLG